MELILNLAWALLAVLSICLWAHVERREGTARSPQIVALLILIVILFPVISVSDDIWALQSPAEADSVQRRDHLVSPEHSIYPVLDALCEPGLADVSLGFPRWASLRNIPITSPVAPAPSGIQNRPPPTA
jgi:hypothetical protein